MVVRRIVQRHQICHQFDGEPRGIRDNCHRNESQGTTWKDFIAAHMPVLAGIDFFTVEVLTWRGLATYDFLFFIHLETRRMTIVGTTKHSTEEWILQIGRNATDASFGYLKQCR